MILGGVVLSARAWRLKPAAVAALKNERRLPIISVQGLLLYTVKDYRMITGFTGIQERLYCGKSSVSPVTFTLTDLGQFALFVRKQVVRLGQLFGWKRRLPLEPDIQIPLAKT